MQTNRRHNFRRIRSQSGLGITLLISVIAVFVILPVSMFGYEMVQYNLCQQQLKACVDSAALAAACSTTSSSSVSAGTTQTNAMNQAYWMFQQNSILGASLSTTPNYTYGTSDPSFTPVANQAQLYFQFLDPVTLAPVAYGSSNGKIVRIFGSFGFVPVFAKFTHVMPGPYLVEQVSDGGLPQIDVILCFDISASMDDFTNVSLVNRANTGVSKATNTYALAGAGLQGPLYTIQGCTSATGTPLNATYPMQLDSSGSGDGNYTFNLTGHGKHTGAVAPSTVAVLAKLSKNYTDCVVNIDSTATQNQGESVNGFIFPAEDGSGKGLGVLVEAARGNLESTTVATAAGVPYATWGITPRAGYFQAYYQAAMSAQVGFPDPNVNVPLRHPIGDAIVAAQNFFAILNNDADVHFGLVTFSDNAGTLSSPTNNNYYVSGVSVPALTTLSTSPSTSPYPPEPIWPPNPTINLIPTLGPAYSNYSTTTPAPATSVNGALFTTNTTASTFNTSTVMAVGGTNIEDALDMALSMHLGSKTTDPKTTPGGRSALSLGRKGATRAIVLFTDGLPTAGGDSGTSDPKSQAEATFAASCGIPVYTIGLCLTPSLQTNQNSVLTDTKGSTGIAALSGNGATFSQTTNAAELNAIFSNVARQLVQLVQ
jgi:hypothetical protein